MPHLSVCALGTFLCSKKKAILQTTLDAFSVRYRLRSMFLILGRCAYLYADMGNVYLLGTRLQLFIECCFIRNGHSETYYYGRHLFIATFVFVFKSDSHWKEVTLNSCPSGLRYFSDKTSYVVFHALQWHTNPLDKLDCLIQYTRLLVIFTHCMFADRPKHDNRSLLLSQILVFMHLNELLPYFTTVNYAMKYSIYLTDMIT